MRMSISRACVVIAALAMSGCDGGTTGPNGDTVADRQAIETMVRDYYDVWNALDGEQVASFLSESCEIDPATVEQELRAEFGFSGVKIEISEVEVLNLTESSADVRVTGTISSEGFGGSLSTSGSISPVVKEGDEWRFANCEVGGPG